MALPRGGPVVSAANFLQDLAPRDAKRLDVAVLIY